MIDELDHLTTASVLLPSIVAFLAFWVRFSIKREFVNIMSFLLDIFATLFVGVMVSLLIADYVVSAGAKWAIIAVSAIVGPDIIAGVIQSSVMFSRTPMTVTLRVFRIVTGKPLTKKEVEEMTDWELDMRNNTGDKETDNDTNQKDHGHDGKGE